jgi:hypothetical protein
MGLGRFWRRRRGPATPARSKDICRLVYVPASWIGEPALAPRAESDDGDPPRWVSVAGPSMPHADTAGAMAFAGGSGTSRRRHRAW